MLEIVGGDARDLVEGRPTKIPIQASAPPQAEDPGLANPIPSLPTTILRRNRSGADQTSQRRRFHRHMKIESIQHRTPDPLKSSASSRSTPSLRSAGIEGGDHESVGGKPRGPAHSGDGHRSVFQWLSQGIDRGGGELRELVEQKNPPMGQTDLAGPRMPAATDEGHGTARMVRSTKGRIQVGFHA